MEEYLEMKFNSAIYVAYLLCNKQGEREKDINIGLVFKCMRFADKIIRELLNII